MACLQQRFPLPNMPFRRDLYSSCDIGTSISVTAQAFQTKPKSFTVQLATANDIAILITVPIARNGEITATARIDGNFTSQIERPIFIHSLMRFTLRLHVTKYVIEIFFNSNHLMDFVHRVTPTEIRTVIIEGPLIIDEVVITPPQVACLDSLPSYEQVINSSSTPVAELQQLNLGSPTVSPKPLPTPRTITASKSASNLPEIGFSTAVNPQPMSKIPSTSQPISETVPIGSGATVNDYIRENTTLNVPTSCQQTPNCPFPVVPTPFTSTSSLYPQLPNPQNLQAHQSTNFFSNPIAQIQSSQPSTYPNRSQTSVPQPIVPGPPYPQQPMPQPYVTSSRFPYPYQQPFMIQQQTSGISRNQYYHPHNPHQHPPHLHHQLLPGTYGFVPYRYGNYPVIHRSPCYRHRRSNSCSSE